MARRRPRRPLRSFLAGGVLGGVLVLAAPRARRKRRAPLPTGLAAFATAPCFDLPPEAAEPGPDRAPAGVDPTSRVT